MTRLLIYGLGLLAVLAVVWTIRHQGYVDGKRDEAVRWERLAEQAARERDEERRQAQSIIDAQAARIIAQEQAIEARDADAERDFEDARRTGDDPVVPDAWLRGVRKPRRRSGEGGTRADRCKAESALRRAATYPGRRSTRLSADAAVAEGQDEPQRMWSPSFGARRSSRGKGRGAGEVAGEAGATCGDRAFPVHLASPSPLPHASTTNNVDPHGGVKPQQKHGEEACLQ